MPLAGVFAINALLAVLTVPFLWNLIPRNYFYGFRVAATLGDDTVWYVTNQRLARVTVPACGGLALLAAGVDVGGYENTLVTSVLGGLTVGFVTAMIIRGWRLANRLRDAQADA